MSFGKVPDGKLFSGLKDMDIGPVEVYTLSIGNGHACAFWHWPRP